MPYKTSKTVDGLITHYGKWTKKEEDAFYNIFGFEDWKGSHGLIPRASLEQVEEQKPQVDIAQT